ncbi:helix-turn-helix domain-containing protein [Halobacillus sp. Nhm2S1]|uniref:helix-turn-helix domain-containing protein n=1 Tax=Halobacillus sp. Nhm2S1 TaxID=2866716 RepID=UPI001C738C9D|nr:helix-turn-helix domain-containing protein [Halobacillus sp. Nhm2S1]MBX0356789.1 AraC family transcriptional regulator [Halobacillus sp. Nhm2S1]
MEMRLDLEHTGVLVFDLKDGEADETHPHDHYQISVPLTGDLLTYHNHKRTVLHHDEVLLVPPGDTHQHEASGSRKEIMLISFNEEIMERAYTSFTGNASKDLDFSPIQMNSDLLVRKAKALFQTASFDGVDAAMKQEEAFTSVILDQMAGSHSRGWQKAKAEQNYDSDHSAYLVKSFIEDFHEEDLTLDRLAEEMNISKYHLHRSFRAKTGLTPKAYLLQVRLEKAAHLLLSGKVDVTHAAYRVGFQSVSTFNRTFKSRYGVTPSQYVRGNKIGT